MTFIKKAALMVCLFLFVCVCVAQDLSFTPRTRDAYTYVLDLDLVRGNEIIQTSESFEDHLILSLSESLELLLTEDLNSFDEYENRFEDRLDKVDGKSAREMFVRSELNLHWAFVYLKFGHELDAALHLRKAYQITRELRKKHPHFAAAHKTSGLLQVMIGSVPDKYNWILDLLDIEGDVATGLDELSRISRSSHPMAQEATMWTAFIYGFVLQKPDSALAIIQPLMAAKQNRLALFLATNLYLKSNLTEQALPILNTLQNSLADKLTPYLYYLKGDMLLQKGDYSHAIESFDSFLNRYKGQNYVKDAWYKTGVCHWLNGDNLRAKERFDLAKIKGRETTEGDKYAAKALNEKQLPNIELAKVRYFTDGGYYQKAQDILTKLDPDKFSSARDRIEWEYRKARLLHKTGDLRQAISSYNEVIRRSTDEELYFAPNACLQLGYLAIERNQRDEARKHFEKALSYKRHEYKNSIDSKARSALSQLEERR